MNTIESEVSTERQLLLNLDGDIWPKGLSEEKILSEMKDEIKFDDLNSQSDLERLLKSRTELSPYVRMDVGFQSGQEDFYWSVEDFKDGTHEYVEKIIIGNRVRFIGDESQIWAISVGTFRRRIPVLDEATNRKYPLHQSVSEEELGVKFTEDTDVLYWEGYSRSGIKFNNGDDTHAHMMPNTLYKFEGQGEQCSDFATYKTDGEWNSRQSGIIDPKGYMQDNFGLELKTIVDLAADNSDKVAQILERGNAKNLLARIQKVQPRLTRRPMDPRTASRGMRW